MVSGGSKAAAVDPFCKCFKIFFMNQLPPDSPDSQTPPRWETLAMIASFALVWVYFLAFQSARRENLTPHVAWKLALLVAVGVLVWVFVRRLKRILAALNSQNKRR